MKSLAFRVFFLGYHWTTVGLRWTTAPVGMAEILAFAVARFSTMRENARSRQNLAVDFTVTRSGFFAVWRSSRTPAPTVLSPDQAPLVTSPAPNPLHPTVRVTFVPRPNRRLDHFWDKHPQPRASKLTRSAGLARKGHSTASPGGRTLAGARNSGKLAR